MQTSAEPSLLEFCRVQPRLSKDHARGPEVLAAWSTQSRTKVPRRGTFSHKLLVFSWLKFLYEALGCSSLRTKLRASSMHLHGLSNKIGSPTRSASSMHRGVRGDSSESLKRYRDSIIRKFVIKIVTTAKKREVFLSLCPYVFF